MNITPELQSALLDRLKNEFAETALSNFAMDIIVNSQSRQIQDLSDQNSALATKNRELMDTVQELRDQIGSNRSKRASAVNQVK